ncbi:N-6 DNA methylase [Thermosynechococcaceae cyanobacterium BACA0444]|uniref:site-specific DNA-methyltransferase (adenine-specific) n=1 Tax=Pseudocalidococcus azoricus BACA0444 TaxID=2918990 RepID=A0AAE4JZX7_9CYAN|nr:N-6 DNA methylase [Pseudocalidococcus azoricus]MDS3861327.1 N-6 DNA methylase [Pseudocalidococcus azoricus BACA0444]
MVTFEEFQAKFFEIFSSINFYEGKSYLDYIAEPQTNDEDNIVDTKIVLPLLNALGFESGDIAKNTTASGKDNSRPDFQVKLASGNIRCFLVEDKHTAYDLSKPEPLQQLMNYAPSRGYELGLICNGRLLFGWDLSDQGSPSPVLHLDIEEIVETYHGRNLFAAGNTGFDALASEQVQDLKGLYRRFHRQNFDDIETLIQEISRPEDEWLSFARNPQNSPDFDELLITDLKAAISLLEEDVLYQLDLLLEEYDQYCQARYLPNGNGSSHSDLEDAETAPKVLIRIRKQILNYVRAYGVLEVDDYTWIDEKISSFAETPIGSIQELGQRILTKLMQAQEKKEAQQQKQPGKSEDTVQLDIIQPLPEAKQKELGIKLSQKSKIIKLDPKMVELLREYERIVFDWKAWQAKQSLTHVNAIKTQQYFISWRNLVTKTVLQGVDEQQLKEEFARQTAYVYVTRLFMVRICEDKGLIDRKFSDGGFRYWKEEVERRYLDLAQGVSMDYLLEMSYRSAQSIYAHFFNSADLFNWYRINTNTLIKVLHILNRFNLQQIDSDIIGMVYGRYVEEGKHEQGRYFTPKNVVEYILDSIGYKPDNPEIRDKTVLDLAGGSGSFLVHAARRLIDSYRSPTTKKIPLEYLPSVIRQVKESLFCLDINPFACYLAETNLLIQVIDLLKQAKDANKLQECSIDRFNVYNTDSLLLPRSQEIRTPLLNPVLDLELSTVSQIKTKTGKFAEGFDYVVGNPPYVRADEPGVDAYREQIVTLGRFETLHKKWDLYIPFIELSARILTTNTGKIGIIISDAYKVASYAEKSREMLSSLLTITQVDFFEQVKLFADADVFNIIIIGQNRTPKTNFKVHRHWHYKSFGILKSDQVSQVGLGEKIFRTGAVEINADNTILLNEIVYISKGMVLNCHEKKFPNEFVKDDLISDVQDLKHPVPYIEGKDISDYQINRIRYLEFGEGLRAPSKVSRPTFPELYSHKHIAIGKTGGVTIVDEYIFSNDSVRVLLPWYLLEGLSTRSVSQALVNAKKTTSKNFTLQYLTAILCSSVIKKFFTSISTGTRNDIFPEDLRKIPVKVLSIEDQQEYISRVDLLILWNQELQNLRRFGNIIKFSYLDDVPEIQISFLYSFHVANVSCWNFLNAEPQRFEVIGDRNQPITKVKVKNNTLLNGRYELLRSDSRLVLEFLQNYLPQYEKRGLTWTDLLTEGKIPKTDADIERIFTERDRLTAEVRQKIADIRRTYQELDAMVSRLYEN